MFSYLLSTSNHFYFNHIVSFELTSYLGLFFLKDIYNHLYVFSAMFSMVQIVVYEADWLSS
jgi:hypothetical protein